MNICINGCETERRLVRGLCSLCYGRAWKRGEIVRSSCSVEDCKGTANNPYTLCAYHRQREARYGDPQGFRRPPSEVIPRREYETQSPTELGKILGVSRQRAEQLLHPQKQEARKRVYVALKAGKLTRPGNCVRCEQVGDRLEAHHWDYRYPFDVRWLCIPCHKYIHTL